MRILPTYLGKPTNQSPTLGAHHRLCPWVMGGHGCDINVHGWALLGMVAILLFMAAILLGMGGQGFHIIMGGHGFHIIVHA